jgi:hypothetical protein
MPCPTGGTWTAQQRPAPGPDRHRRRPGPPPRRTGARRAQPGHRPGRGGCGTDGRPRCRAGCHPGRSDSMRRPTGAVVCYRVIRGGMTKGMSSALLCLPGDGADDGHLAPQPACLDWPVRCLMLLRFVTTASRTTWPHSRWWLVNISGEERVQTRRERSPGELTIKAGGDASVAVQDDGDRHGRHLEPLGDGSGRVEQHGIGDTRGPREAEAARPGVLDGDGQEPDTLGRVGPHLGRCGRTRSPDPGALAARTAGSAPRTSPPHRRSGAEPGLAGRPGRRARVSARARR